MGDRTDSSQEELRSCLFGPNILDVVVDEF